MTATVIFYVDETRCAVPAAPKNKLDKNVNCADNTDIEIKNFPQGFDLGLRGHLNVASAFYEQENLHMALKYPLTMALKAVQYIHIIPLWLRVALVPYSGGYGFFLPGSKDSFDDRGPGNESRFFLHRRL